MLKLIDLRIVDLLKNYGILNDCWSVITRLWNMKNDRWDEVFLDLALSLLAIEVESRKSEVLYRITGNIQNGYAIRDRCYEYETSNRPQTTMLEQYQVE